ncbi:MAG: hypothetical protein RL432_1215 [Bacteroidota bacterium]|jgi:hypothetical protein
MPSKIEAQIDRIHAIFMGLKTSLIQERERVSALKMDLNKASEALELVKLQNAELTSQLNAIQNAQPTNQQVIMEAQPGLSHRREDEIDALVNEIEFCIQQLKDKNA